MKKEKLYKKQLTQILRALQLFLNLKECSTKSCVNDFTNTRILLLLLLLILYFSLTNLRSLNSSNNLDRLI